MDYVKVRAELYNGSEKFIGEYISCEEAWLAAKDAAMKEAVRGNQPLVIGRKSDKQVDVIYEGGKYKSVYSLETVKGE